LNNNISSIQIIFSFYHAYYRELFMTYV
jgi:hypothetical protein